MSGIKDLDRLLENMSPKLDDKEYVFCTIPERGYSELDIKISPLLLFREKEGITLIIEKDIADSNSLPYSDVRRIITLNIHSDLAAVGFLARITKELADAGISLNVVSAYYHDHLFVQAEHADNAMEILKKLSK